MGLVEADVVCIVWIPFWTDPLMKMHSNNKILSGVLHFPETIERARKYASLETLSIQSALVVLVQDGEPKVDVFHSDLRLFFFSIIGKF